MKKNKKLYRGWALVSENGQVHDLYMASKKSVAIRAAKWQGDNWTVIPFAFYPYPSELGDYDEKI